MTGCVSLVVASGRGERFGGELPKQYQRLAGRPVLRHCLETLVRHPRIDGVRAVIHPSDRSLYDEAAAGLQLLEPALGGASRQDSVRQGLESLAQQAPALVLIHDGVRALLTPALIDRVVDRLQEASAVLPALPVTDTLKRVEGGAVGGTVDRGGLYRAQTPQGFRYDAILQAHRAFAGQSKTDDCALAEAAGLQVAVVAGEENNIKITERADLARAEQSLAGSMRPRVGMGFDVHRLGPGDGMVLMGVPIAGPWQLIGHSDADVGLHALTDALLGALGAGDIGSHFPPSEQRWADADSALFLRHAGDLVTAAGGVIEHVDVTLICEQPKIGPHRPAMVARVAELLSIAETRISVKATTTERLGFAGRGEGVAAQAAATVYLPA